jgi:Holliday junction resolvase RusA-like endonuclease
VTDVVITVAGDPWPEGSVKAFVRGGKPVIVHDNPDALGKWRDAVNAKARLTRCSFRDRPVEVDMLLWLPRPRSHYRTGRYKHLLRDTAPAFPVAKFDSDKLARAVLDALTGVLYAGDGQVTDVIARKRYADLGAPSGAVIRVREVLP